MYFLRRLAREQWLESYEWYAVLAVSLAFAVVVAYGGL
jgi:hypothetical protein